MLGAEWEAEASDREQQDELLKEGKVREIPCARPVGLEELVLITTESALLVCIYLPFALICNCVHICVYVSRDQKCVISLGTAVRHS